MIAIDLLFWVIVAYNKPICIRFFVHILNIGFVINSVCQLMDH
jgi:hypothetical protein